jgi:branched-chain amino acid transport system permease protein
MQMRVNKIPIWPVAVGLSLLALFPLITTNTYLIRLVILAYIWIIVTSNWNLVMGVSGIFSLAQLALFAVGGYVSAMLALYLGISPWITTLVGALAAVIASIIIGLPTLRLKGVYVVLLTLAFHEILRLLIASDETGLTGGAFGLFNVPNYGVSLPGLRGGLLFNYYLGGILCLGIVYALFRITNSPIGLAFQSLRDSERYATSRGISPFRYKMLVFMISAFFTGLAGAFYAHYFTSISPTAFSFGLMLNLIAMIVLGGWGTFWGPIIGTSTLLVLSEFLHGVEQYRLITLGLIMTIVVVLFPGGLITIIQRLSNRFSTWLNEGEGQDLVQE